MQQYTLVDRPVILSENKRNVIPHGRPLSPIGTVRSMRPFFVPRQVSGSLSQEKEKHGDTISLNKPLSVPSTSLMQYHKSAHENLMTINNNLSNMLKESCAGIDSICQKVRLCLLEANTIKKPENVVSLLTFAQTETCRQLSTCEEEGSDLKETNDVTLDMVEDLTEEINKEKEKLENEKTDNAKQKRNKKSNENKEHKEIKMIRKPKRTPSLTPFFTMLNPQTQSAESVGVTLIRSKSTAESFHQTMKEVEKLTDYEQYLKSQVEGINKQIEQCYSEYPKLDLDKNMDEDKKDAKNHDKKDDKPLCSKRKRSKDYKDLTSVGEDLQKKFQEIRRIHKDLMEDQFSDYDLTQQDSRERRHAFCFNFSKSDFVYPDVYRKRAITDLHRRLEAQVEANDSFIFFQKLMAKNRKYMEQEKPSIGGDTNSERSEARKRPKEYPKNLGTRKKQRSLADLSKKYQDSLWFRQKKHELKSNKKERRRDKKSASKKEEKCTPKSYTIQSTLSLGNRSNKNRHKKSTSAPTSAVCDCRLQITNDQPMSEAGRCKIHWMRAKYNQLKRKKLKYLDILDDITKKDLLPIKSEYPRRDTIKSTRLKDSYLYKLLYSKTKGTERAWEQLFQPALTCSNENCMKCSTSNITEIKDGKSDKNKDENNLTISKENKVGEPQDPRGAIYQNNFFPVTARSNYDMDKAGVIRKLSKYIFYEGPNTKTPEQVYTVLPVHVFYDNSRIGSNNRRNAEIPKLPLIPMKETKEPVKKAEWNDVIKRTKPIRIVYDPILRKIEKEIRMVSAKREQKTGTSKLGQTHSWSPKNFSQYCSANNRSAPRAMTIKMDTLDKTPSKQKKSPYDKALQMTEIFKRSPKASTEKISHPVIPPHYYSSSFEGDMHQKEMDVKQKIQKTISDEARSRIKSDHQRKIWENKYGKSVGQKLLNFIEKQPDPYQTPVPKYALPTIVERRADSLKQKLMLEQLRHLKQKNDSIQSNIQKAIEVIENKMVDILSKPSTSESIEAFDAMEKEITNVLTLMKTSSSGKNPSKTRKLDEANTVSDELFKRLDKILESPGMSSSGKSSQKSVRREAKSKEKTKLPDYLPPKSTDMKQICFSSTSASGEEKFTITAISPKRSRKGPSVPPFLRTALKTHDAVPEDVASITNELRKLENELHQEERSEDVQKKVGNQPDHINEAKSPRRSPISKHRNIVPLQEQVVNLALFDHTEPEGSAGDQLNILNQLLENDLKSIDDIDDKTHSIVVSSSHGDYDVQGALKLEADTENSTEKGSDSTNSDLDIVFGSKEALPSCAERKKESEFPSKSPNDRQPSLSTIEKKRLEQTEPQKPKDIQVTYQEATVATQKTSQLSVDVTGPYFTPMTSPLTGTRSQIEEHQKQCCPIVEEERQRCHIGDGEGAPIKDKDPEDDKGKSHEEDNFNRGGQIENGEGQRCQINTGQRLHHEDIMNEEVRKNKEDDKSNESLDDFYLNVNKIISRVENVYNQLEEFEEEMLMEESKLQTTVPISKIPVFKEEPPEPKPEPDTFLTPFMHAVKDLRKTASEKPDSRQSSPRMHKSPSFYNVLSFLDSLADFREERIVEVYTSRLFDFAHLVNIPKTFNIAHIHHQSTVHTAPPNNEIPHKKSGCLKNPSSHSTMSTNPSRSKQKVSFCLHKEEKGTQATACPFHSVVRMLSQNKMSNTDTFVSVKKDEQVSAYLDARENKSVDRMSMPDDESTYQELSDEMSSNQMPEQVVQNIQKTLGKDQEDANNSKKNVVEIFRHSNSEDNRSAKVTPKENNVFSKQTVEDVPTKETVKVFYDDFKIGHQISSKIISGFYNEDSILQVQQSLSKDLALKKRDSLEKLVQNLNKEVLLVDLLKETTLLEPLKNLNSFIDSDLLKEVIEKRQKIRMMRRKSSQSLILASRGEKSVEEGTNKKEVGEKENLLKGFYVFVYLVMFTALNLEFKCVQ